MKLGNEASRSKVANRGLPARSPLRSCSIAAPFFKLGTRNISIDTFLFALSILRRGGSPYHIQQIYHHVERYHRRVSGRKTAPGTVYVPFSPRRQLTIAFSLQDDIQTELVLRGMSDAEDSTMAEYVAVMLSEFFGRGATKRRVLSVSL